MQSFDDSTDATPAYRGYRLQALYTLARIFSQSTEEYIFQPEGKEDLAILDESGNLIEVIQIKQRTNNLNLSSLAPENKKSFFYRISNIFALNPTTKIKLVAFGNIGSELLNAINKSGTDRKRVAGKIATHNFITENKASEILQTLELEQVEEHELFSTIRQHLSDISLGLDTDTAFDSLLSWLYKCAENKTRITRQTVIDKINNIGKFISERAAHHQEWFSTIVPLEDKEINDSEIYKELSREFYRGVSARYEHILVNLDVPRQEKIQEIKNAFGKSNIVIMHGSSGQGKTTIAYRYIKEHFPSQWRFQVRFIRNVEQAANIALAIASYAQAIEIPMIIYLDISPNDTDWIELLKILKSNRNIKILVTIREEDLRRTIISNDEMDFQTVELLFNQEEAEKIYRFLVKRNIPSHLLDFEDAWSKFGGDGPLLEFTYLVTQGKSLRERLKAQIKRLSEDVRLNLMSAEEMSLLRLVAIASAFETRLKTKPLCQFLGLSSPESTLQRFEKEYLIRLSNNGHLIGGVHPIRSEILTELLTDNLFNTWLESAKQCLSYLAESDLDNFLLYCFSRHKSEIENPLDFISNYHPNNWQAFAGVTKSLIWLGVSDYIEENTGVIDEAFELFGSTWAYMLDFDLAGATDLKEHPWYEDTNLFSESIIQSINELKERQTDKNRVFTLVQQWLKKQTNPPNTPQLELEWQGFLDTVLLIRKLNISLPVDKWITEEALNKAVETLPLKTLSEVILAVSLSESFTFNQWLTNNRARVLEKCRREQLWAVSLDNDDEVSIQFLFDYSGDGEGLKGKGKSESSDNNIFNKTQENLELLRNLFPHHKRYSTQGFGHILWDDIFPFDESIKNVQRESFPLTHFTTINSLFIELANFRFRPENWKEFAYSIIEIRKSVTNLLVDIKDFLNTHFRDHNTKFLVNDNDFEDYSRTVQKLRSIPLPPKVAVDEWGLVSNPRNLVDSTDSDQIPSIFKDKIELKYSMAAQKYSPAIRTLRDYTFSLTNFLNQARDILAVNAYVTGIKNKTLISRLGLDLNVDERLLRLSSFNLTEALEKLSLFQNKFNELFSKLCDAAELDMLIAKEREVLRQIWRLWYFFAFLPEKRMTHPSRESKTKINDIRQTIRKQLNKKLKNKLPDNVQVAIVSEEIMWEEDSSLWIKVDVSDPLSLINIRNNIIDWVAESIAKTPNTILREMFLKLNWKYLVIIPLINGNSIDLTAWKVPMWGNLGRKDLEIGWTNFILHPIPKDAVKELNLQMWNLPKLEVGNQMIQSIMIFQMGLGHLRHISSIVGNVDSLGNEILQDYLSKFSKNLSEPMNLFLTKLDIIKEELRKVFEQDPENNLHLEDIIDLASDTFEFFSSRKGDNELIELDIAEITVWFEKFGNVLSLSNLIHLVWIQNLLQTDLRKFN